MRKLNPEYIERVTQFVNHSPYFELLSMKILDVGLGFSLLEVHLAEKHLQPFGFVHGGVYASIIDAAAFWALFCGI
ncbi:MAG: PaaI family thioesterase [Planctomycetota bacterium]